MFEVKVTIDASPELVKIIEVVKRAVNILAVSHTITPTEAIENDTTVAQAEAITETAVSEDLPFDPEPEPARQEAPQEENTSKPVKPEDMRAVASSKDKKSIKALLQKWGYKSISEAAQSGDGEAILAELRGL